MNGRPPRGKSNPGASIPPGNGIPPGNPIPAGNRGERGTARSVLVADAAAGAVVRTGGMLVILAVLGILAFLVATVVPLFTSADVRETPVAGRLPIEGTVRVLAVDEYRMLGAAIGDRPEVVYFRLDTGETIRSAPIEALAGSRVAVAHRTVRSDEAVVAAENGRVALLEVGFSSDFVLDERASGLRARMRPGDVVTLEDGAVRRVAGGNLLRVRPKFEVRADLVLPSGAGRPVAAGYASHEGTGALLVATADNGLHLARESATTSLTGATSRDVAWAEIAAGDPPTPDDVLAALVDEEVQTGWIVGRKGTVLRLDLTASPAVRREIRRANVEGVEPFALTAAGLLIGGRSLVLCDSRGGVGIWSPVPAPGAVTGDARETRRLHALAPSASPAVTVAAGITRRTLYLGHDDGSVTSVYTVNDRVLAQFSPFSGPVLAVAPGPKDDGIVVVGPGLGFKGYDVDSPHPEASLSAFFAKTHYEGYSEPVHKYESSAGTDEAEPKLSLWLLLLGTLKATLYSMLFAVPLALLAALYTSQFMHPRVRAVVKPAVEVMAGLPSVVLGFVAALVLAPFVAEVVPAVLAFVVLLPVVGLSAGAFWYVAPARVKQGTSSAARLGLACALVAALAGLLLATNGSIQRAFFAGPENPAGDFKVWLRGAPGTGTGLPLLVAALALVGGGLGLLFVPRARGLVRSDLTGRPGLLAAEARVGIFVLLPALVAAALAWPMEQSVFGGDFRRFLQGEDGSVYDQRNSLVVGIAMGFAVIPIIYTIAEDALSAIPESLKSAALACGASPWQTAIRIVAPAAAPGIFSAIMVGLGRAVGETMIVLMATGGTAIEDWSVWNGFRTLSQNIATELPEAPQGGTHYRILFLAGLLLFALTFVVNTAAEVVRLRFRRRFKIL